MHAKPGGEGAAVAARRHAASAVSTPCTALCSYQRRSIAGARPNGQRTQLQVLPCDPGHDGANPERGASPRPPAVTGLHGPRTHQWASYFCPST